jgi:antitoxin ParD1/3/4
MTSKSSISLTDDQYAFAKAMVESGRYPSISAVLQQGVELLRRKQDQEEAETAALREILARRRNGAFIGAVEMDHRIDAIVSRKRRHRNDVSD